MTTAQLLWFLTGNAGLLVANGFLASQSFRAMRRAEFAAIVAACYAGRHDSEREGDEV